MIALNGFLFEKRSAIWHSGRALIARKGFFRYFNEAW